MSKEELKEWICGAIDRRFKQIEQIGDQIMSNPELGFKEFKTAALVTKVMKEWGVPHQTGLAITGVRGIIEGKKPGPTIGLIGELDAVLVSEHPAADPETKAAHACGHNVQIAGLLGAMMGLLDADAFQQLSGRIIFFAVPAEEYVEIGYRLKLIEEGKLHYLGGKPELIRLGHFDDIDLCMMIHTHGDSYSEKSSISCSSNGCIVKMIRFIGLPAHAGAAPHKGINALNAAQLALSAINAQRETFRDEDTIRVHPIITKGGDLVNVVPSEVLIETYVRGRTNEAILDANAKVDRALRAGAMAVGARVEIETLPGFMPLLSNQGLKRLFRDNCLHLFGDNDFVETLHETWSTDMGDVSHIMPAIQPSIGGAGGGHHSSDWYIRDKKLAYTAPAKVLALSAVDLLWGEGEMAKQILAEHQPAMSKAEYLQFLDNVFQKKQFDDNSSS